MSEETAQVEFEVPENLAPEAAPSEPDAEGVLEIKRSKRLRGNASFAGDAHAAMLACGIAALSDEAVRLENLPEAAWFTEFRTALEALGATFEPADAASAGGAAHWLVRGPAADAPVAAPAEPVSAGHDLALLLLIGIASGRGVPLAVRPDPVRVSPDAVALVRALYPEANPASGAADEAAEEGLLRAGALHPKARNACKPSERPNLFGRNEPLVKVLLLFHHLAARESLDLQVKQQGSDLLENLMRHFEIGLKVERDDDKDGDELARRIARQMRAAGKQEPLTRIRLAAGARPRAAFVALPGDAGEAAAVALAATLIKGSDVMLEGVTLNPGRSAFFAALRRMGGDVEVAQRRERFGDTVGAVRVRSSDLLGRRFDAETLSDLRDEVFLLLIAAAFAEGESVFRDLDALRAGPDLLKQFNGVLKQIGVETGEIEDGLVIRGRADYDGGAYDALGHPGLAAAYAVLGAKSHGVATLAGADALERRYPRLRERLRFLAIPE